MLTNELKYESIKYVSNYYIFKITTPERKLTVRTKKVDELTSILQQFSV